MAHVVFHTAFVGDLLLSIPFFRRVKKLWPDERIYLVCRPGLGSLFKHLGVADEVFELDKKNPAAVRELVKRLNTEGVKYLFCPHESFRTAWVTRGIQAEKKIGFRNWWNRVFFNTRVNRPMDLPEARRMLSILSPFDKGLWLRSDSVVTDEDTLFVPATSEARAQALQKFELKKPFIVIAPSSQWPTKKWTHEGFAGVIATYLRAGKNIYVVGAPSETADGEKILALVNSSSLRGGGEGEGSASGGAAATHVGAAMKAGELVSLMGKTSLLDLHALMAESELVIANDSGPMHMATVAGVPVVAIFGPTTLALGYRPWSNESAVVQKDLSCRPCGKHGHVKCPIGTHECMKGISAKEVIRAGEMWIRILPNSFL